MAAFHLSVSWRRPARYNDRKKTEAAKWSQPSLIRSTVWLLCLPDIALWCQLDALCCLHFGLWFWPTQRWLLRCILSYLYCTIKHSAVSAPLNMNRNCWCKNTHSNRLLFPEPCKADFKSEIFVSCGFKIWPDPSASFWGKRGGSYSQKQDAAASLYCYQVTYS